MRRVVGSAAAKTNLGQYLVTLKYRFQCDPQCRYFHRQQCDLQRKVVQLHRVCSQQIRRQ